MSEPLNILLFTTDQQRGDCIGLDGNAVIRTPYLDALGRDEGGVYFTSAYAEAPACVPQRTAWMLGQHPLTCGQNRWRGQTWQSEQTLTGCLAEQGYRVGVFGKRHFHPIREPYGAHEFKIYESGRNGEDVEDYLQYLRNETEWGGYSRGHGVGNNDVFAAASVLPEPEYPSSWIARESVSFLDRHAQERPGQPFFLWTSFNKPHSPYDPPAPYDRMYRPQEMPAPYWFPDLSDELPVSQRTAGAYTWASMGEEQVRATRAYYYGMITHIDHCMGRVLKKLETLGLKDNTVIAFTSDHGDMMGDHHMYFKGQFFEGSTRVPYVWWCPPGRRAELDLQLRGQLAAPVGISSLMPSLLDLAGAEKPASADAASLLPLLRGEVKLESQFVAAAYGGYQGEAHCAMLRWEKWKYIYWQLDGVRQLFDLQTDPGEMKNLADDPAHRTLAQEAHARMERELAAYPYGKSEVLDAEGRMQDWPGGAPADYMPAAKGPWGRRAY